MSSSIGLAQRRGDCGLFLVGEVGLGHRATRVSCREYPYSAAALQQLSSRQSSFLASLGLPNEPCWLRASWHGERDHGARLSISHLLRDRPTAPWLQREVVSFPWGYPSCPRSSFRALPGRTTVPWSQMPSSAAQWDQRLSSSMRRAAFRAPPDQPIGPLWLQRS